MFHCILFTALALALPSDDGWAAAGRADMKRALSLDGVWTLTLDPRGGGREERWGERTPPLPGPSLQVPVPGAWERRLPGYHLRGWYETLFECPRRLGPG